MQIASKTSIISKLTKALKPIMKFLFPDIKEDDKVHQEISMNIVANIMGLGNAATPLGLKAMASLQKQNIKKDTLSNSMAMFIVLNTASLQIIPTTVIAIRTSLRKPRTYECYYSYMDSYTLCRNCGYYSYKNFNEKVVKKWR